MRAADRDHNAEMRALMDAARTAATANGLHGSVLRGAASHTGAWLLGELERSGWRLVRIADRDPLDDQGDRA